MNRFQVWWLVLLTIASWGQMISIIFLTKTNRSQARINEYHESHLKSLDTLNTIYNERITGLELLQSLELRSDGTGSESETSTPETGGGVGTG